MDLEIQNLIESDKKSNMINYNEIVDNFILLKNNSENQILDDNILKLLDELFGNTINKKGKKIKKTNNILKNNKIQQKKDSVENKVNLILNKLSENNINNLIIEFIDTFNQVNIETFEEIQKIFYLKIINEINFVKIYLDFFKLITYIYNKVQNYNLEYFFNIIELKFHLDYNSLDTNAQINDSTGIYLFNNKYEFIIGLNIENNRINNLSLIKNLINNKLLSDKLLLYCDEIILNQQKYLSDIYYWYSLKNNYILSNNEIIKIENLLLKNDINIREKVLLESLIADTSNNNDKSKNIIDLEINNLMDNYYNLILKKKLSIDQSVKDINEYIIKTCKDAIMKNIYCEKIFHYYLIKNFNDKEIDIFNDLIEYLIKLQILLKSNICKGLLLNNNNWDDKIKNYNNINIKMKKLIKCLVNNGITKPIEFLIDKYNN
jgi:hypothetical protein